MEGKNSSNFKIKDIVQVSLMAALTYAATSLLNVPVGAKAVTHLGDSVVFLSAVLLGSKKAFLSSAVGMCLFDLLSPYAVWAPFTFVIKGVMGFIAGVIVYRGNYEGKSFINNLAGFLIAGVWMIAGYFVAGRFIYGNFATAAIDIPGNIFQVIVGTIVALPLSKPLRTALKKSNFI